MWNVAINALLNAFLLCYLLCNAHASVVTKLLDTDIQNIFLHEGSIYIGAVNFLYKLNLDLEMLVKPVSTGPKQDQPICLWTGKSNTCTNSVLTDNYNKILVNIEHPEKALVVCGTVHLGNCALYDLSDLTRKTTYDNFEWVAANLPSASTAAYVKYGTNEDILVVARTMTVYDTQLMTLMKFFCALSVRSVSTKFELITNSRSDPMIVNYDNANLLKQYYDPYYGKRIAKATFLIDYVTAFHKNNYEFFLTVQQESVASKVYISKLVRWNLEIKESYYIEQTLGCKNGDVDYNILVSATTFDLTEKTRNVIPSGVSGETILAGVFTISPNKNASHYKQFAICVWRLSHINSRLDEFVENRANIPKPEWIGPTIKDSLYIAPTEASQGIVIHTDDTNELGGINAHVHGRGVSLYVSTKSLLFELALLKNSVFKYGEVKLPAQDTVYSAITIGPGNEHLYMKSNNLLAKMSIFDCSRRTSCLECLYGAFCGWCTLENKCSQKSECSTPEKANFFIEESVDKCPKISNIEPKVSSVTTSKKIKITAINLPAVADFDQYACLVHNKTLSVTRNGDAFECEDTFLNLRSEITDGVADTKVALITKLSKFAVVMTEISVFDCTSFLKCDGCVSGKFNCGWCSKCVYSQDSCVSPNWIQYQGQNVSFSVGCPRITSLSISLVPVNVMKSITLFGTNLPQATGENQYFCIYKYDGRTTKVDATWSNSKELVCQATQFDFTEEGETLEVTIAVQYQATFIDVKDDIQYVFIQPNQKSYLSYNCFSNEKRIHVPGCRSEEKLECYELGVQALALVIIYKCHVKQNDCSLCLSKPPVNWKCGWCADNDQCMVKESCNTWVNENCPKPDIIRFFPFAAPVGGQTEVSIFGTDFGVSPEQVTVNIGGYPCVVIPIKYETSQKIVCNISNVGRVLDAPINVTVTKSPTSVQTGLSKLDFRFKKPLVNYFYPERGPCSGGTHITINGTDLDIGGNVSVDVGEESCVIMPGAISDKQLVCKTKGKLCNMGTNRRKRRAAATSQNVMIKITIDGYELEVGWFVYDVDPTISDVFTNTEMIRIRTFASGGQLFKVEGNRLSIIQEPKMIFNITKRKIVKFSICNHTKGNSLECLAPNVSAAMQGDKEILVTLGFEMDAVANVRSFKDITVVKDPVIDLFEDGLLVVKTDDLILTGTGFSVLNKKDIIVKVADKNCEVKDLDERLVCTLPKEEDLPSALTHKVLVMIGQGGLQQHPGSIQFYKASQDKPPLLIYIGTGIGAFVVIVLIIIIFVVLFRRKQKKDRSYKAMVQIRMDKMESQYARECKEAFAEFQTETTDLTQDVDQYVTPYHDFRGYAMRVLYPGLPTHPILESDRDERPLWKDSMIRFTNLMKDKDFLLTFIRTLEAQPGFHMTDRCIVASLLMACLQDDLTYTTRILQSLLADLIKKTGTGKTPKLLLRRTESVAEKLLTNWLAYVLHDFVESRVGEPLFRLFTAISILLEKEPIDAITCDAKNSLSEDKLLRQKIDFTQITVNAAYVNAQEGGFYERIPVLTVDTITQTKTKLLRHIYKNKPYKSWPNVDDLLLGVVSSNGAILLMHDEDNTSVIEGEWKQINTLAHYKVPDNASLRLAGRHSMFEGYEADGIGFLNVETSSPRIVKSSSRKRILSRSSRSMQELDKSDTAHVHDTSLSSIGHQQSHASTPMLNHDAAHELKLWHMVKQTDYPQEPKEDIRQSKMMAEVYLTRLLKTKETLQDFVNNLFDSIFGVHDGGREIPPSVKFLFDFLDEKAKDFDISDNEVMHTWKNNSLPLRFWINMIKNPEFVFDIKKSNTVDSCLSVIAQLFMDSCSPDDHRLGKDSPSNKLLYAKQIPEYKKKVKGFYTDVKNADFDEEAFADHLLNISVKYGNIFNSCNAASELMAYVTKYKVKVMENLEENGFEKYAEILQHIMESIP